ncbi:MAG: Hsp20/alpha crystallin family protein [Spirochaetaceae bacterium]|nr:Hsp20/alpha crystallin family protein [Spirochaetaceae bacterium]
MKSLTMYHPMDSVRTLVDIDKLIGSFFGAPAERTGGERYPAVDVRETSDAYIFEAALPGCDDKDVEVHVDGNTLTIESKHDKVDEKKDDAGNYIFRERYSESFSRSFKLPENADPAKISADFKNGLLCLTVDKRAESQKRVVAINAKKS